MQNDLTDEEIVQLPIIPLRNTVIFPGVVLPVDIGREKSLAVTKLASKQENLHIAMATQTKAEMDDPSTEDLYPTAVEIVVMRVMQVASNRATVLCRGLHRLRLLSIEEREGIQWGSFTKVSEIGQDDVEAQGLGLAVRDSIKQLILLSPAIPEETNALLDQVRSPGLLADVAASHLELPLSDKIELLSQLNIPDRLRAVLLHLHRGLETHKVKEHIDSQVRAEMGKHQREAMLRQRMRAIQDELGEGDDDNAVEEFEERLKEANLPQEAEEVAQKQLARLRQIPSQSPEHTVTRTYLEWLIELPWNATSEDHLDLGHAREILDEDHYGLQKVKKRIVEYLAVRQLKPDKKGPILCLVGPPGVGKTSTGRSVARALGREFIRVSLGGVRDEAEIRGHRRTYVGALPGRILQGLKRAGTRNPVFVLDEIDKLGNDFRGDPSSALLEVLDPEQNDTFSDHFIEVPFDLSQVLFFTTANQLDPIPPALRDRLEILELPGYTRNEKLHIAKRHLIPKQVTEHGLEPEQFPIKDDAVLEAIDSYTREAGVRNLERELASICRYVAVRIAQDLPSPSIIERENLYEILGPVQHYPEMAERTEIPGVATGLAWTPVGGEILFIEATRMKGKGRLILTGHLGNVMQESATAALTYARSKAARLGLQADFFAKSDIHLHVPAGAIRKDGPSAGVTMVTALVSLITQRAVRNDIAMTGEISLRGQVLPVGGVKEKVLAAHRAGIRQVFLPHRNQKDLMDIPQEIQDEMKLVFVKTIDQMIDYALIPDPNFPPLTDTALQASTQSASI